METAASQIHNNSNTIAGLAELGKKVMGVGGDLKADEYRTLAKKIDGNEMRGIPTPLTIDELEKMLIEYGIAG